MERGSGVTERPSLDFGYRFANADAYAARLTTFSWCPACNATHRADAKFKHKADCPSLFVNDTPYAFWLGKDAA